MAALINVMFRVIPRSWFLDNALNNIQCFLPSHLENSFAERLACNYHAECVSEHSDCPISLHRKYASNLIPVHFLG